MERSRDRRRGHEQPVGREGEAERGPERAVEVKKVEEQLRRALQRAARQQQRDQALGKLAVREEVEPPL